ncbi:flagellar brake protein [Pseudocitrobacter cyperus]|uniref:PilZ domain-containing protein n=1 Tax=Pseudocitrobacter cyperus TaxID=3112843 RepID=A0ABV0HH63_9ENTR
MEESYVRQGLFESVAIIREALKKGCLVDIHTKKSDVFCKIQKLDAAGFYVPWEGLPPEQDELEVEIFADSGKFEFHVATPELISCDGIRWLYIHYPEVINVTQRRKHPRLLFRERRCFFAQGKFNDGLHYQFRIKDLSPGGCALLVEDGERALTLARTTLRNIELDFGSHGTIVADLFVLSSEKIATSGEGDAPTWHLSCQFKRISDPMRRNLESIVIKLLLEEKRLHRM